VGTARYLEVSIRTFGGARGSHNNVWFNPITLADNVEVSGLTLDKSAFSATDGWFDVYVDKPSTSVPGEIKFTNIAANIDRTVPFGEYEIMVTGTAIRNNWNKLSWGIGLGVATNDARRTDKSWLNKRFDAEGLLVPYISIATDQVNRQLTPNVRIWNDPDRLFDIEIDGVMSRLDYPVVNDGGYLRLPVRHISHALGINDKFVEWDPIIEAVTITVGTNSTTSRVVQMFKNSSRVIIDGAERNMFELNADMVPVQPQVQIFTRIYDERMYVPFRNLAQVFGIRVTYCEETRMAEFNPRD
jgi:hypothetical protein